MKINKRPVVSAAVWDVHDDEKLRKNGTTAVPNKKAGIFSQNSAAGSGPSYVGFSSGYEEKKRSFGEKNAGSRYTIVPTNDPYAKIRRYATVEETVAEMMPPRSKEALERQITDVRARLDELTLQRQSIPVMDKSKKPDLATILFGSGSSAPTREMQIQAQILDTKIEEAERELSSYQEQLLNMDIWAARGKEGVDGWKDYPQNSQEEDHARQQQKKDETAWETLGRYLDGNTRDTTLPFHINELEMAEGYRKQEQRKLDAGEEQEQLEDIGEWATRNPFNARLATYGAILASPVGGMVNYLNDVMAYGALGYIPETDGSVDPWEFSQAVTSSIHGKLNSWGTIPEAFPIVGGKGLGDAYSLGVSVAQSTLAALSGGPGQAIVSFIGPAAAAAKDDALLRGADDDKALIYGGIVGLIEAGTEAVGAENIVRLFSSGGVKALFSSAGMGEALEEGVASLATFIADVLIHREDSTFAKRVDAYEAGGATRYVAVARAALDTIDDILYDTAAGGVSGWAHAAMAKAWDAVTNVLDGEEAAHRTEAGVTQVQTEQPTLTYSPSIGQALTDGVVRGARVLSDPQASIPIETLTDGAVLGAEMLQERSPQTSAASQTDASSVNTDTRTNRQDTVWSEDADVTTDSGSAPVRYEDALREYLGKGTEQNAAPDAGKASLQETAPKPKEQLISELAPKISKPGITPGRATIEAQRLYADAERTFGPNADTVLETFEAGQEPRKFFDGIKTAYLSGKMGSRAALENSTAAAYLTEEQKTIAYEMGENAEAYANNNVPQRRIVHKNGILGASGNVGEKARPYSQRGIQIERRLQNYLDKLQRDGNYISVPAGEIKNRDLAVLTTETGVEFTVVNAAGKTFLIRGGENYTTIPQEIMDLVIESHGSIECHSHPYIGDLVPSDADKRMMELLTWLNESTIIDPTERIARFNALGLIDTGMDANERDTNYYKDMIWGEE